jgi:uncharacterized membrane protein YhaH (DUF805 family)
MAHGLIGETYESRRQIIENAMKIRLQNLWRLDGEINRAPFLVWAGLLFAVKYNLDRLLVYSLFGRHWSVLSYFEQPLPGITELSPAQNAKEFAVLLAASVPFLWIGVMLCLKRLRSAQLPLWLAVLFTVPILKWFLFAALAVVPERRKPATVPTSVPDWLPRSRLGSAAMAVGVTVPLALGACLVSTEILHRYGWALFVGMPFCTGFMSALIHGARVPRRLRESLAVSFIAVGLTAVMLLALAFEGVVCLVMAAPIGLALGAVGAIAGHAVQVVRQHNVPAQVFCVPILAMPLMFGTEALRRGPPPVFEAVTAVEVNAPVEVVWRHVVEFSELPPPKEFIFKLGIAYPIRAEIHGHGVGAVRHCVFSTGPFVEPIEVWDEPRLLKFSVTSNPAPMQEWSPYHNVHPPHMHGFLVSEQGQFLLTPLPGGRTRLEGTTWYRHTMWPAGYWQLWSNQIIHAIHRRVLNHVRDLSERDQAASTTFSLR